MKWLPAALAIFETVSRTVDRIGPVSFEPMEKHPERAPSSRAPEAQRTDSVPESRRPAGSSEEPAGSIGFDPSRPQSGTASGTGGGTEPSSGGANGGGSGGDDDSEPRAFARSMRPPTLPDGRPRV